MSHSSASDPDVWRVGDRYEPFMGRWSRLVAAEFIGWLAPTSGATWLDVGCGTGALTEVVVTTTQPRAVLAVDPSPDFVRVAGERLGTAVSVQQAGAGRLPLEPASVDYVVSGLVLNFVPDPVAAVAEMRRVTRPGGTVSAYVWDYADRMQMLRHFWDAAASLDPAAQALDEGQRFPLCQPGALRTVFTNAGLTKVSITPLEVTTKFAGFDDYWEPFLGGQGPAPAYCVSLPEQRRAVLRDHLLQTLPTGPDGAISLVARAWAVRGISPDRVVTPAPSS